MIDAGMPILMAEAVDRAWSRCPAARRGEVERHRHRLQLADVVDRRRPPWCAPPSANAASGTSAPVAAHVDAVEGARPLGLGRHLHDDLVAVGAGVDGRHLALARRRCTARAHRVDRTRRACWRVRGRSQRGLQAAQLRIAGDVAEQRGVGAHLLLQRRPSRSARRRARSAGCTGTAPCSARPPSCRFWIGRKNTAMPGTAHLAAQPSTTCFIGGVRRALQGDEHAPGVQRVAAAAAVERGDEGHVRVGAHRSAARSCSPIWPRRRCLRGLGGGADLADVLPGRSPSGWRRTSRPWPRRWPAPPAAPRSDGAARSERCARRPPASRRSRARSRAPARRAASCAPRR